MFSLAPRPLGLALLAPLLAGACATSRSPEPDASAALDGAADAAPTPPTGSDDPAIWTATASGELDLGELGDCLTTHLPWRVGSLGARYVGATRLDGAETCFRVTRASAGSGWEPGPLPEGRVALPSAPASLTIEARGLLRGEVHAGETTWSHPAPLALGEVPEPPRAVYLPLGAFVDGFGDAPQLVFADRVVRGGEEEPSEDRLLDLWKAWDAPGAVHLLLTSPEEGLRLRAPSGEEIALGDHDPDARVLPGAVLAAVRSGDRVVFPFEELEPVTLPEGARDAHLALRGVVFLRDGVLERRPLDDAELPGTLPELGEVDELFADGSAVWVRRRATFWRLDFDGAPPRTLPAERLAALGSLRGVFPGEPPLLIGEDAVAPLPEAGADFQGPALVPNALAFGGPVRRWYAGSPEADSTLTAAAFVEGPDGSLRLVGVVRSAVGCGL